MSRLDYHDTLEVRIRKKENRTAKISNLKDVSLSQSSAGNYDARTMSFCVYVSDGGQYLLRANGGHTDHNNEFNLSQGSRRLPYQIDFRSNREPWQTGIKREPVLPVLAAIKRIVAERTMLK